MNCFIFSLIIIVSAFELCSISATRRARNAHCQYYSRGVGKEEKEIILEEHNKYRKMIMDGKVPGQPKGKNLKLLKYDEELADEAQRISDTCEFRHVRVGDDRWHAVGQNLYTRMSTSPFESADWKGAIKAWYSEFVDYEYGGEVNSLNGHYTQLIWGDTEYVGCGYTYFDGFWDNEEIYTCNYGPAGNYVGELPYEIDE